MPRCDDRVSPGARRAALRTLAAGLEGRDLEAYAAAGADPLEPLLGEGDPDCRVCVFGRDPGRQELVYGQPFVGAGGQKIRAALHRAVHGSELPDFEASLAVGSYVFWANTVPYKPLGNKAWKPAVVRAFAPLVRDLLVHGWRGTDVLCMGQTAFLWFGHDRVTRGELQRAWAREDRFRTAHEVELTAPDGTRRTVRLRALPHPSPLNAVWGPHFPGLADAALADVGLDASGWRV